MKKEYKNIESVIGTMIMAEAGGMRGKELGKLFVAKIKQLRKKDQQTKEGLRKEK